MLFEYIQSALKHAEYKKLDDDTWFAEILNFPGVWANAKSIEECRTELAEVLEEWILLKIRDNEKLPEVDGLRIQMREEEILSRC
jgi:predicted RNase H-like HicB family nuclease